MRSADSRPTDVFARTASFWRNAASAPRGPGPLAAAAVLVGVLAVGWITDFSYVTQRAHDGYWRPYAQALVTACAHHPPSGNIILEAWGGHPFPVPCTRIRGLGPRVTPAGKTRLRIGRATAHLLG